MSNCVCRGMVHALSLGSTYKLGSKYGMDCLGWKAPKSEVTSTTN